MVLVLDTTWQAMMDTYRNEVASKRCGQYFFSVHASPGVFFFFFFFFLQSPRCMVPGMRHVRNIPRTDEVDHHVDPNLPL